MSVAEISKAADAVFAVLPPASTSAENSKPISEIAQDAQLDDATVRSALGKLKREGKAQSNGKRGAGSGWRKAKGGR